MVSTGAGIQQGVLPESWFPELCFIVNTMICLQTAIPFLIGTKYDVFSTFPRDEQEEITKQAKKFNILIIYSIPLYQLISNTRYFVGEYFSRNRDNK